MKKLYAACWLVLACVVYLTPTHQAFAYFPHGYTGIQPTNYISCGFTTNNWCVGTDGWTVFTAADDGHTGTCSNSGSNYSGTCITKADNTVEATVTASIAGTGTTTATLTIQSGSGIVTGGTMNDGGVNVIPATGITVGTNIDATHWNLICTSGCGSLTVASQSMNELVGNDATCAAEVPPTIPYTSASLSTFSPTKPACVTQTKAASLSRSATATFAPTVTATLNGSLVNITVASGTIMPGMVLSGGTVATGTTVSQQVSGTQGGIGVYTVSIASSGTTTATTATLTTGTATSDWLVTRKGTVWATPITGGNILLSGKSPVEPFLIAAYGTGARPEFIPPSGSDCLNAQAARGFHMGVIGQWCYHNTFDPNSASFAGVTVTADIGTTICGATTAVCNISPSLPGFITSAASGAYHVFGNGINFTGLSVTSSTATTAALGSATPITTTIGTGQIKLQITSNNASRGIVWNEFNLVIMEDNRQDFGAISIQDTSGVATHIPNARVRRNLVVNSWIPLGGVNVFTGYATISGSMLFEENIFTYGGWNPQVWAGAAANGAHSLYLHNPSPPLNLLSNIVAYNPADNQYRDSGTAYNNLALYQANDFLTAQTQDNPLNASYNVIQNGYNIPTGTRAATAADGIGASVLHMDGVIITSGGVGFGGEGVTNFTNPGSIPTSCTIGTTVTPTSVNLVGCTTAAGNRGDGVQVGDVLRVFANGNSGILVQPGGQYVAAQPGGDPQFYQPYSAVAMNATTGVITDPFQRTTGEPFSFTPVIITGGGTGYGASATGTLTWNSTGCTTNPVINVSTNAAGVVVAFNSIVTPGVCGTPPPATASQWTAGGGLSAGTLVTLEYNLSFGTLPTGVSLASASGGGCTGSLVANPNTGQTVCTYYALASGLTYNFAATSGGSAIIPSGSNGTSLTRTGSALFDFSAGPEPIFVNGIPAGVVAGTTACPYSGGNTYFAGSPSGAAGCTTAQSVHGTTLITNDATVSAFESVQGGTYQTTFLFGVPNSTIIPTGQLARVGPNNIFSHATGPTGYNSAILFNTLSSGWNGGGNYMFNWNPTPASNTLDFGFAGLNTLVGAQVLNTASETRFPKSNIEYYDASQLESGNTFTGYIDNNGGGSAGYVLTITSGSPPTLAVPSATGTTAGATGDTIFDTTANANVVSQYTQVVQQIDATHYYVSVSQTAGSAGSPITMMYGSVDRFLAKATSQSHDAGWVKAYTAEAANDFIRTASTPLFGKLCGNTTLFTSPPACPLQGYDYNFLLKRDLDPASNDNDPMWLEQAA